MQTLMFVTAFFFTLVLFTFKSIILLPVLYFTCTKQRPRLQRKMWSPALQGKVTHVTPLLQSANNLCTILILKWQVSVYQSSNSDTFCVGPWILDGDAAYWVMPPYKDKAEIVKKVMVVVCHFVQHFVSDMSLLLLLLLLWALLLLFFFFF